MNSSALSQRLAETKLRLARLDGAYLTDQRNHAVHTQKLSLAKGRLALAEEVSTVFNALQKRAHQRSVGAFERLLSAILEDVMPDEGSVRLIPEYKSNATWLDVALDKKGNLEDILDANGGAVTAVVSTGLRFAALSRTQNRKLMVLDESGAWIAINRVAAFVQVLAQIAQQPGTQVLFLSHQPPELFSGIVNMVKFEADEFDDELISVSPVLPLKRDWEDAQSPGIREIELVNFRRHKHTVVPCYPGATAYIGDSNLGKSTAIATSFKAVAYGESDDSIIRHGQDEAKVIIRIENDERIEWTRTRKKNPVYRHYRGDVLLAEGKQKARNEAPTWVSEVLKIARVDDLDVQIGNQKQPVFLLNESAPRRAQILSVGRESSHYHTLMKKYEETKAADRETCKASELELGRLNLRLAFMKKLPGLKDEVEKLLSQSDSVLAQWANQEKLGGIVQSIETLANKHARLSREAEALKGLPQQVPTLHDVDGLRGIVYRLERHSGYAAVRAPAALPPVPALSETASLESLIARLERLSVYRNVGALPQLPALPEIKEVETIALLGAKISKGAKIINQLKNVPALPSMPALTDVAALGSLLKQLDERQAQLSLIEKSEQEIEREVAELKEQFGGMCPLCGGKIEDEQKNGHVH